MKLKLYQWATTPPAGYPGVVQPPPAKLEAGWANGEEAPAGYFNYAFDALADVQNELVSVIEHAGMTPSESDLTQVHTAIERMINRRAERSGITQWVDLLVTGAANNTRSVAASEDAVVAVGAAPSPIRALTKNAYAWVAPSAGSSYAGQFNDVHFAGVGFLAVGTAGEIQASITGGTGWARSATGGADLNAVTRGGAPAVVVGNAGVIKIGSYSAGVWTWATATSAFPSESMNGIAWSPTLEKFCAVGTNGKIQCADEAGVSWSAATTVPGTPGDFLGIIWSEKHQLFIAWTAAAVYASLDGMTWQPGKTMSSLGVGFQISSVVALDYHLAIFSSLDHNYVLLLPVDELHLTYFANAVLLTAISAATQDDDYFVDVLHVYPLVLSSPMFYGRLLGVTKNGKIRATHYFG